MKRLLIITFFCTPMHNFAMRIKYERPIGAEVTKEDQRRMVKIMSSDQIKQDQIIVISQDGIFTYAKVIIPPCTVNNTGLITDYKAPRGRAVNFDYLKNIYLLLDMVDRQ